MQLNHQHSVLALEPAADESAAKPAAPNLRGKAEAAAEKFEAFFIADMMRQMRRTAREFGDQDEAKSGRTNEDMLDLAHTLVADVLAKQHAFGVADLILRQVLPPAPAEPAATAFNSVPATVALNK